MFNRKIKIKLNFLIFIILHVLHNGQFSHASNELSHATYFHNSAIATAIADIIDVFYVQQEIPFDILVFGSKTANITAIVDGVLERNKGNYVTTIKWFPIVTEADLMFKKSAIVFFVDEVNIPKSKAPDRMTKKIKFFYFCLKGECLFYEWVNVLYQNTTGVLPFADQLVDDGIYFSIYSYKRFYTNYCNWPYKYYYNFYDTKTNKWYSKLENHGHLLDFFGCQLTLYARNHNPHFDAINGEWKSNVLDTFRMVGKMKNFTPHFESFGRDRSFLFEGKRLLANIAIDYGTLLMDYIGQTCTATTFSQAVYQFIISPGELYTSYEKLYLPFDDETWLYLIVTFASTFVIIFFINQMSQKVKDIVFGEGVNIPAFNVVATFFGIGQLKLPQESFARIILITFIFFCLIIRTAYQGVQFDMMTKEMRRKPAQSIQQLYDENYTFWVVNNSELDVVLQQTIEPSKRSFIRYFENTWEEYHEIICNLNSSVKQAVLLSDIFIRRYINDCPNEITVLSEVFSTMPEGLSTYKGDFFYAALDQALQLTIPMGIPQYELENYYTLKLNLSDHIEVENGPEILTLEGLSFGFVVWLVACGVSTCGLICELIVFFTSKFLRKSETTAIVETKINLVNPPNIPVMNATNEKKNDKKPREKTKAKLDIKVLTNVQKKSKSNLEIGENSRQNRNTNEIIQFQETIAEDLSNLGQIKAQMIENNADDDKTLKNEQNNIEDVDDESQEVQQVIAV